MEEIRRKEEENTRNEEKGKIRKIREEENKRGINKRRAPGSARK